MNAFHPAHDDDAHVVLLQVEGDAHGTVFKLHQFLGANVGQPRGSGNPVAGLDDVAHLFHRHGGLKGFNLPLQFRGNLLEQVGHVHDLLWLGSVPGRWKYTRKSGF